MEATVTISLDDFRTLLVSKAVTLNLGPCPDPHEFADFIKRYRKFWVGKTSEEFQERSEEFQERIDFWLRMFEIYDREVSRIVTRMNNALR